MVSTTPSLLLHSLACLLVALPAITALPFPRAFSIFAYQSYVGDGSETSGWPSMSTWTPFELLFRANRPIMATSCTQWDVPNNSDREILDLHDSILEIAALSNLPAAFILAITMQESNGCVRVPTTHNAVRNPGLMQDHNGAGTCNDNSVVQTPCPRTQIRQMIHDGVMGTSAGAGFGLKQLVDGCKVRDSRCHYRAARVYNSGSVHPLGDLWRSHGATEDYAGRVANRLRGWVG